MIDRALRESLAEVLADIRAQLGPATDEETAWHEASSACRRRAILITIARRRLGRAPMQAANRRTAGFGLVAWLACRR
jgi:hypothetical protein